jgi:diguanylate cyclase (GGDEF)-like protein
MTRAATATTAASGELVPLAERLRYMLLFRLLAVAGVLAGTSFASEHLLAPESTIVAATTGYLGLALLAHAAWRLTRRRGTALFGLMLIVDGAFLAWAAYATGGAGSPVRYLIVLEVVAVCLLASYRTGLKLAAWQSLLLVAVYYAQKGGVFTGFDAEHRTNLIGTPWEQAVVFAIVLWTVAIATAWFSAVNERDLRRRRGDLEALAALTARLERESHPGGVADALLGSVVDTFEFERAVVIGAPDGRPPVALAEHGAAAAGTAPIRAAEGSVLELATRTRTTQLVKELDPAADAWLHAALPGARNLIVVPLHAEGRTAGALVAEHASRAGSRVERRLVSTVERFADHGALALRNAWLLEEVSHLAANDPLTGLANRMTFGDALERELARAHRDSGDVTLVMLDLDHFKRLNDTRGHQAGDEVLRRTAATLREQRRAYDTVARYGGEEFALIAPGLSARDAQTLAERIRAAIAGNGCDVTASIGVATYPGDAADGEALIAAADKALYHSKHAGRDRVSLAASTPAHV